MRFIGMPRSPRFSTFDVDANRMGQATTEVWISRLESHRQPMNGLGKTLIDETIHRPTPALDPVITVVASGAARLCCWSMRTTRAM